MPHSVQRRYQDPLVAQQQAAAAAQHHHYQREYMRHQQQQQQHQHSLVRETACGLSVSVSQISKECFLRSLDCQLYCKPQCLALPTAVWNLPPWPGNGWARNVANGPAWGRPGGAPGPDGGAGRAGRAGSAPPLPGSGVAGAGAGHASVAHSSARHQSTRQSWPLWASPESSGQQLLQNYPQDPG